MRFLCLAIVTIFYATSLQAKPLAFVFNLNSSNKTNQISCTASLLKFKNQCRLLTDKHCIINNQTNLQLNSNQIRREVSDSQSEFFPAIQSESISTTVLKDNCNSDLAELSIPSELEPLCASLDSLPILNADHFQSSYNGGTTKPEIIVPGYVKGEPLVQKASSEETTLETQRIGLKYSELLYKITGSLRLFQGMSGSPVFTNKNEFVGLFDELIPGMNQSFITPNYTVGVFLKQTTTSAENCLDRPSSKIGKAFNAGKNSQWNAGNNTHAGGGNNTHAGGGLSQQEINFDLFRTPLEGYPLPEQPDKVLLAAGPLQIDGSDDYALKYTRFKNLFKDSDLIVRDRSGYPDLEIRKNILLRLQGHFEIPVETNHIFKNESFPDLMEIKPVESSNWSYTNISIQVRPDSILLAIYDGRIANDPNVRAVNNEFRPIKWVEFHPVFENDYKSIILKPIQASTDELLQELTCDNKNYLKLICSSFEMNHEVEMTLSLTDTTDNFYELELSKKMDEERFKVGFASDVEFIRWTRRTNINNQSAIEDSYTLLDRYIQPPMPTNLILELFKKYEKD